MLDVFTSRYFFTFLANLFDLTLRSNLSGGGNSPTPPFGGTPPAYGFPRCGILPEVIAKTKLLNLKIGVNVKKEHPARFLRAFSQI